jgi:hypothetical protein
MTRFNDYFYGNKISDYGRKYGRVDYATFAKAFDAVLNNNIMEATADIGYWEMESGFIDNSDAIDEIQEKIDALQEKIDALQEMDAEYNAGVIEDLENKIDVLQDEINDLEYAQDELPEVFQWYIVDDNGADICKEFNEIVYYNETLDIYLWGVTHWGTAWDYVLTDIECNKTE